MSSLGAPPAEFISIGRNLARLAAEKPNAPALTVGERTVSFGELASSMIALISCSGSRHDTGCGTAPIFQQANSASMNPKEFGNAMVTKSPCLTP